MAVLRSERYPSLVISDLGVEFAGGTLETDDPRVIARARRLSGLGITVEDDAAPADAPAPRARRTKKAAPPADTQ